MISFKGAEWRACHPQTLFFLLNCFCAQFRSQNLPVEEIYAPALNVRVRDNRSFGRRPIVGVHSLRSIQKYRCPTPKAIEEVDSGAKGPAPKGIGLNIVLISTQGELEESPEGKKTALIPE